jgi:hypothetical protein
MASSRTSASTFVSRSVRGRFLNADSIVLATDFMAISNAACPIAAEPWKRAQLGLFC